MNKQIKYLTLVSLLFSAQCVMSQTDSLEADNYISKAQNAAKLSLNDLAIQYYQSAIEASPTHTQLEKDWARSFM